MDEVVSEGSFRQGRGYASDPRKMSTRLEDYKGAPEAEGTILYEPDWYLLILSPEVHASLLALLDGVDFPYKAVPRPHVSVIKEEGPGRNKADWGVAFVGERVSFRYRPYVHGDNGLHLWVDCYSPRLCELREHFGLTTLKRDGIYLVNFHSTVARRKKPIEARIRPQIRLFPQSHIDAETGMQHL